MMKEVSPAADMESQLDQMPSGRNDVGLSDLGRAGLKRGCRTGDAH